MKSVNWLIAAGLIAVTVTTVQAGPMPEVTHQQVMNVLPELSNLAQQTLEKTGVPGMAIAVVYKDQVVYLKGFGVRKAGTEELIDADTVFQLASLSKPITSTVLAGLVGDGLIDWDDLVVDHWPDFRLYDPWVTRQVTLRDLLCHRSGLPAQVGDLLEDMGYGRMEILRRLRYVKPATSFRSHFAYTNFGFTAAAIAAALVSGKRWEDLVADNLYHPLGMKSSSSRFRDFESASNRAFLHVRIDGAWVPKYVRDPDAQSPAGGVSSTARDLAQWMRLQLNGGTFEGKQIIAAEPLSETHRPQIVTKFDSKTNRATFYGLGWNVGHDDNDRVFWTHSGAFYLGMRTEVALLPAEGIGIAVLSNAGPTGVPEGITKSFFDLLFYGKFQRDWVTWANRMFEEGVKTSFGYNTNYSLSPSHPSPGLASAAYIGIYHNDYFGDIDIVEKDGALVLHMGLRQASIPLRHWSRDVFIYQPVGESAGGLSGVTFRIDPEGKATEVVVENLDIFGQGAFIRAPIMK
ncbi:MAG: serine hydrolase [Desulfomonilaceae bacterium]